MAVEIHGFCAPEFQPLKDAFAANFEAGLEVGASLALMQHGRPVVDLWAGHADWKRTRPWEKDTIVVLFSTTKVALVLSFLMLVDRGLVDLDATVATYWPEFAAAGKEKVTVREAMTHRSGVPGLDPPVAFEALHDWDAIATRVAAEPHWFGGESRLCYHMVTYGFILGEIMRRVDGRRPSQFFREEIAQKAGIDIQIGLGSRAELERVAAVGYLEPPGPWPTSDPLVMRLFASVGPGEVTWERLSADISAGNGYGNARAVARLCAIYAMGGELDGVRYLSKATIEEASSLQVCAEDWLFGWIRMGLGFGLHSDDFPSPTPTCVHWGGSGGSIAIMDPGTGVSGGYAMNNLIAAPSLESPRYKRLWDAFGETMRRL